MPLSGMGYNRTNYRNGGMAVKQEDKRDLWRALGAFSNIGFTLASSVLVGLFLGRWIDNHFQTSPWASLTGIVIGLVAGFWSIYKQVTSMK